MPCLDDDIILRFLEGRLPEPDAALVVAHLDGCPDCRGLVSSLARATPPPTDATAATVDLNSPAPSSRSNGLEGLIGSTLGNFRVTGFIGAGAMGAVFAGEHVMLGHKVAIKVMQPAPGGDARERGLRFVGEAKALTRIKDPHVIQLHDFGELEGGELLYYVMEHLEGRTLEEELRARGPLSPEESLGYLEQIGAGLQAVHDCRILHRDLKPSNVMVLAGEPLRLKLLDFGLARHLEAEQHLTVGGLGTPLYAAPELVLGERERIGPPTDVFSLGVIAYRMLSGRLPYEVAPETSVYRVFMLPAEQAPIPLGQRAPTVDPTIARLVDGCLEREPGQRPTARGFCEQLRATIAGRGEQPEVVLPVPRSPQTGRRRRRWVPLAAAGALLAVGATLAAVALRGRSPATRAADSTPSPVAVKDLLRLGGEVVVSSQVNNRNDRPEHLVDGDLATAWNSRSGDLRGAWIALRVAPEARVTAIRLTAGYGRRDGSRDLFTMNHRLARVRVSRAGGPSSEHSLDVARRELQELPVSGPGGEYWIEVLQTVPGTERRYREVCVSELQVAGQLPVARVEATPLVRVGAFSPSTAGCPAGAEPAALECAVEAILLEATPAASAVELARRAASRFGPPGRHLLAVATNTRGYRLDKAGQPEVALPLFALSAELDPWYGMPRYNAARLHARRSDVRGCLRYLLELKELGWAQRSRMLEALRDQGFSSVWSDPGFKSLYCRELDQRRQLALRQALSGQVVGLDLVDGLDANEVLLVVNAIFARHGRAFESKAMQDYFYGEGGRFERRLRVDPRYRDRKLTRVDWANARRLRALVRERKQPGLGTKIDCPLALLGGPTSAPVTSVPPVTSP